MTGRFSTIRFIANPVAGTRRGDIEPVIRKALEGSGTAFEVVRTERRGHATGLARAAVDEGIDLVVAVGGDGTTNEVGTGLVGTQTPLGLLPAGSGNALARALGVPIDPERACRELLSARPRPIDAGRVGGRWFFSTAGIGLDAEVTWLYDRRPGGRRGFLPYAALTGRALLTYVPQEITIIPDDGEAVRVRPMVVTVANTAQYGNGAIIAPGARPDDGLLDLCAIEHIGLPRTLWHARRLFTGTIDRMPGVRLFRGRAFRIVRPGPGRLQADGEAQEGGAVLDVEVVPNAIRIALPEGGPNV